MTSTLVKSAGQVGGADLSIIEVFCNRYGDAHLLLACHAALPLGLTPELLYSIWDNFKIDCYGTSLGIPWIATADLLLSNLCEEVGAGLYEMDQQVRASLLSFLEQDKRFELKRIRELAAFLATYVQPKLKSENLDVRDFAQAQSWVSIAYLQPEKAAPELFATLVNTFEQKPDDLLRIASIVGALKKPLVNYPDLLTCARGMVKHAQGDIEAADKEFKKIKRSKSSYRFAGQRFPLPRTAQKHVEIEQKKKLGKMPLVSQFLVSVTIGMLTSGAVWLLRAQFLTEEVLIDPLYSSISEIVLEVYAPEIPSIELNSDKLEPELQVREEASTDVIPNTSLQPASSQSQQPTIIEEVSNSEDNSSASAVNIIQDLTSENSPNSSSSNTEDFVSEIHPDSQLPSSENIVGSNGNIQGDQNPQLNSEDSLPTSTTQELNSIRRTQEEIQAALATTRGFVDSLESKLPGLNRTFLTGPSASEILEFRAEIQDLSSRMNELDQLIQNSTLLIYELLSSDNESFANLRRLNEEFAAEYATLRGRVNALEADSADLTLPSSSENSLPRDRN